MSSLQRMDAPSGLDTAGLVAGAARGLRKAALWVLPQDENDRKALRMGLLRVLIAANVLLGLHYLAWRYLASINWEAWPIALLLLLAETYSFTDTCLFGMTMWRSGQRATPPPPAPDATVDVCITCYNEPVELVRETAIAARDISWPHQTYILDDGGSGEMRAMAAAIGVEYIERSSEWRGKARHAKAGNLNNALFQTTGEFILVLDADQKPLPTILDRTLGYFRDPEVAFVQTPQYFYNVPKGDPFGSEAPLFYGPIQQGKDGWNAAFFCGSNAVLRREALMQIGIVNYVHEMRRRIWRALRTANRVLRSAEAELQSEPRARPAIKALHTVIADSRTLMRQGAPLQEVTWMFQRQVEQVGRTLVASDMDQIRADLSDLGLDAEDSAAESRGLPENAAIAELSAMLDEDSALDELARREASPLAAIETVRGLLLAVDVDRSDEAQPVMPMSTISVTEDMATAMRMHAAGWRSIYHDEILAHGLAPEDLRTSLQQRLRWAQGTIQVMLRENPLVVRGLSLGQRLMYFTTMWSYLSGFFSIVYLVAPVLYLFAGVLPVRALSSDFFWHLVPYLLLNQLLFAAVGWGRRTWRGQQYSLALFPLWIKAVTSAVANVVFHRGLGFVVTPKTRPGGVDVVANLRLVRPQVGTMALLLLACAYGLSQIALGLASDPPAILINVFWAMYDVVLLSAVLDAATHQPDG